MIGKLKCILLGHAPSEPFAWQAGSRGVPVYECRVCPRCHEQHAREMTPRGGVNGGAAVSSNSRKSVGGNIRRLIIRERGDVRGKLLKAADWADAEGVRD